MITDFQQKIQMHKYKYHIILLILLLGHSFLYSQSFHLESPDSNIKIHLSINRKNSPLVHYNTFYNKVEIMKDASFGLEIENLKQAKWTLTDSVRSHYNNTWKPVYGETDKIINHFNSLQLTFKDGNEHFLKIGFRAYNEGLAYRYKIEDAKKKEIITILSENSNFNFPSNPTAWITTKAQGEYQKKQINDLTGEELIERPLTLKINDKIYASLGEAALTNFARMKFCKKEDNILQSHLDGKVSGEYSLKSPWRFVLLGNSPGELLSKDYLILNLNSPNKIKDTGWIKPGKVIRSALTNEAAYRTIDFASNNGLQYVLFDSGWYGKETDPNADATTATVDPDRSPGPFDLKDIIDYGKKKDIGIILYVNRRALENQLDTILPLYHKWGVKGVKFGFVQVGPQEWTTWLHKAVIKAAQNKLMVDIHDEYRPTGFSRTYPNLMTQEGIRGDEEKPAAEQNLITLFSRLLAGPADQTNSYFNSNVQKMGSHGIQLAKTICLYSPWQFLFWYDHPPKKEESGMNGVIRPVPEMEFFKNLPTVWEETKVLEGEIGGYATIARRKGKDWYIGIINGPKKHDTKINFSFLDKDQKYRAEIYSDDPKAKSPTKISKSEISLDSEMVSDFHLEKDTGMAIHIFPVKNNL